MRTFLALLLIGSGLFLMPVQGYAQTDNGLMLSESAYDAEETVSRLVSTLEERGLTVVGTVDHAANAARVDQELRPTQLIIFGNPNLGTPLMQNSRSVAIDLPQKYLVWTDSGGRTFVTYNSVPYLVERHGLTGPQEVFETVTGALANFAGSVAPVVSAQGEPPTTLPVTGRNGSSPMAFWVTILMLAAGTLLLLPRVRSRWANQKLHSLWIVLMLGGFAFLAPGSVQADSHGLVVNSSPHSVDETVAKLQAAIESRNLNIMMTIDHAANAAGVDKELPPTQLILFGNPNIGTGLMQVNQSIGIDLPQKMLVWEDDGGNVQVAYNDPTYLGTRHNISGKDEVLTNVAGALAAIVQEATAE